MKPIKTTSRMHPVSQECLQRLCDDPTTTLCIFSGSERNRLSQAFAHLPKLWIAAENGCFIRPPLEGKHSALSTGGPGKWITMVETSNFDWIESVQLVFDYFCERTPRSYVETRETSLVWSYKYADPDFGRQQARDLLQHLWTGPISNAAVDVIQGAKSVEVRPIGVSKGAAIERIVSMMGECGSSSLIETEEVPMRDDEDGEGGGAKRTTPHAGAPTEPSEPSESLRAPRTVERRVVDFVMCCGHFLGRDEDIFEYIERCSNAEASNGDLPPAPSKSAAKSKGTTGLGGRPADKNGKGAKEKAINEKPGGGDANGDDGGDAGPTIVTTFGKHYTCTVGRKRSGAGYYVNDSDDIAELLVNLTNNLNDGKGRVELLQFDAESSLGSSRSLAELARQNSGQSISRSASQHRLGRNPSVSNVSNISDTSSL